MVGCVDYGKEQEILVLVSSMFWNYSGLLSNCVCLVFEATDF